MTPPARNVGNGDCRGGCWNHPSIPGKRSGSFVFVFRAAQESVNLSITSAKISNKRRGGDLLAGKDQAFVSTLFPGSVPCLDEEGRSERKG